MATRKSSQTEEVHFHQALHRLTELLATDASLLDQLADCRLAIAECLVEAESGLCPDCLENLERDLPITVAWDRLKLPADWTALAAYRSYRDRLEQAVAEVPEWDP